MKTITLLFCTFFVLSLSAQNRQLNINDGTYNQSEITRNTSLPESNFLYPYKKARPFSLNQNIKRLSANDIGIELLLDLFPSQNYLAIIDDIKQDANGTLVIRATLTDSQMGFCIITLASNGTVMMRIEVPETAESYTTQIDPNNDTIYLAQSDLAKQSLTECHEPLATIDQLDFPNSLKSNESSEGIESNNRLPSATTEIDVMVVYTQAAENWAIANNGSIANTIAMMETIAQTSFDNSMIDLNYNVVYSHKTDYVESGTFPEQLSRLRIRNDGYLDEVHALRVEENADFVVLLHTIVGGGVSYIPQTMDGDPAFAFCSLTITGNNVDYLNIHESGHIFGAGHHKEQLFQPGPGLFDYSAGWRWNSDNDIPRASILTYGGGAAFPDGIPHYHIYYFSDPNITYFGTPVGDAMDGNNARTIREMKDIIAAYSDNLIGCDSPCQYTTTIFTPTTSTQTNATIALCYSIYNVTEGTTYFWSLCTDDGGQSSIDSQLTLRNNLDGSFLAFNEDACGDDAKIIWEADFTGEVQVLPTKNYCFYADGVTLTLAYGIDPSTIFYDITTSANPTAGGTTSGDGTYGFEQSVTVNATNSIGYEFINWTENGTVVSTNANYTFLAQADRNLIANFELETYQINAQANPTNAGTITGAGNYTYGDNCTLSATENTGYTFNNWTENGTVVSTNANYSFTVTENKSLIANFDLNTYDISTVANPTDGGNITGGGNYQYNSTCNLIASPNPGYGFVNWTENGSVVSTNANYSFTVVDDRTLTANFELGTFQISAEANPTNAGTITGAGSYSYGDSCTLSATENTGYTFINWTENGAVVSTDASYSFTVTENKSLIANFELNTYTVSTISNPTDGGNITGGGNYQYNSACNLTASPNSGYGFVNWTENGSVVSTNANYSFTVVDDRTLTANFELGTFQISAEANPTNAGTITGAGSYSYGDNCTLSASENTGYTFINWTENGTVISTDANYSFTVTENKSLIANFDLNTYTVSTVANPTDGGNITGGGNYQYNSTCNLNATPNSGYDFVNWTENGSIVSTNSTFSFTVTDNRTLTGNFLAITQIPDPNFEQALIDLGIDTDAIINGQVFTADIINISTLSVQNKNISDLSGIQDFYSLTDLSCDQNQLTQLNLGSNIGLVYLSCSQNDLSHLDVSSFINLEYLNCYDNNLSFLDVSQNINLKYISCLMNQITDLDLSENTQLTEIYCQMGQLQSLNVQNGNNGLITNFLASDNPNLTCIQVDDETAANAGTGVYASWLKDPSATYSEDCTLGIVDYATDNPIEIFPNPVSQIITVKVYDNEKVKDLNISNVAGQMITKAKFSNQIDVSNLSAGLYFIQIKTDQRTVIKKIIKK
ncbi:InlB B-repeat-containing protein [Aequorivita capsosiphonis]|uniref:InlB B-repeat-containing protein n=1 Tax=Aequorivita capsosiphonis TaxID=487317 RepID=UPI0004145433|nr:T9SS type A sorting domain-containing protein [Aequorivita capsosiphonis]